MFPDLLYGNTEKKNSFELNSFRALLYCQNDIPQ